MKKIKWLYCSAIIILLSFVFPIYCSAEIEYVEIIPATGEPEFAEEDEWDNGIDSVELADEDGDYKITDFFGCYYYNTTEDIFKEYNFANPQIMELYINTNGRLERYDGMYYGTTGTSFYYEYYEYEIVSNTLICKYEYVRSVEGICNERPGGTHTFILGKNGDLIEGEDVWYKSSTRGPYMDSIVWENEQNLNDLEDIFFFALNAGNDSSWNRYTYTDRAYGLFDLDGDGKIEAIEKGCVPDKYQYQFVIYKYYEEEKCVKRLGTLMKSTEEFYYSPKYQRFVTYFRTSTDDQYFFYQLDEVPLLDFIIYTYTDKTTRWFGYEKNGVENIISEVPFGTWDDVTWDSYVSDFQEIQFIYEIV